MTFQEIQNIISNLLNQLSIITNGLFNNGIFQIIIGIVLFGYTIRVIYRLISHYITGDTYYVSNREYKRIQKKYFAKTGTWLSKQSIQDIIIDNDGYFDI